MVEVNLKAQPEIVVAHTEHRCERCRSRIIEGATAMTWTDWIAGMPRRKYYHPGCYWKGVGKLNPDDPASAALEPFAEVNGEDPFIFLEPFEAERRKVKKNPAGGELLSVLLWSAFMLAGIWWLNEQTKVKEYANQ